MPGLDDSDPWVRTMVKTLSSHPKLAGWLLNDDLIHRFTLVTANIAYDENPRVHVPFLEPVGKFRVDEHGETMRVDPRSYERYDLLADVFTSLDTAGTATLYGQARPLIEEVYDGLGYPADFEAVFSTAVAKLLSVPILDPDVEVAPRVISFEFADADLERLSDAEKQLLRMGPRNVARIQAKLREIAEAIAETSARPPGS